MERQEIITAINNQLAEEFEKDSADFALDGDLRETLEIDSLDIVDVIVMVERLFAIKTSKEDFANVKTFNDLYDLLDSRINNK
ncbi:MAG: phosphopantetheine-binding protein [Paludibacteraceae bacterium]|nr:phosphopantetheine-binding protein [Paludibacteraceae bacterium]